ncbi:MAG TPA: thioredoxin family protein [Thermoanaerobaculia bacterium]|nr:thioredoxin family protein [Thermoanaerobaculia bacterium]
MSLIALVLAAAISSTPTPTTPAPREWRDSIRDVYIDGKLERGAQTLSTSSPRMIAVVCGEEVLLLDPETQAVARAAKSEFAFAPDRVRATSATDVPRKSAGTLVKTGTTYLANIDGKSVLVAPHQSPAGAMTIEELWETAPVWRAIADHYQPDGALIERLRAIDQPVKLEVVLATWCGDSRQYVPRLLKSIAAAANPNVSVELIGIDSDFHEPMEVIAGRNITNVPTVIVKSGARELGRFIETPAGATIEDDICDIVNGTPKPHRGRIGRGALLSSGTYVLRDARKRAQGTEAFALYEKPGGGGVVAHSVIARNDGTSIETWATPAYVEVTTRGERMTRTRFYREGEVWTAVSRGASGIVEQVIAAPASFVTPATITYAWSRDAADVFVVPEQGSGSVSARRAEVAPGAVPRFVRLADGSTRTLVSAR